MRTTNEEYNDYIMSPANNSTNSIVQKVLATKENLVDTYIRLDEKSKSTFRRLVFTSISYTVTGFIVSMYAYLAPQGVEGPCATTAAGIISLIGWVVVDTATMRYWYNTIYKLCGCRCVSHAKLNGNTHNTHNNTNNGTNNNTGLDNTIPSVTLATEFINPASSASNTHTHTRNV